MAAIAGTSDQAKERTTRSVTEGLSGKARGRGPFPRPRPRLLPIRLLDSSYSPFLLAVPEQPEQHQEEVDEVEVEPDGAHDCALGQDVGPMGLVVALLDLLGVVRCEAHEDQHADRRDGEFERRAL